MKFEKLITLLFLLSIFISIFSSNQFNYDEFKEKSILKKIKYLYFSFFFVIEQYSLSSINLLNSRNIVQPYDFFSFFIAGCIFRIIFIIFKKIYNSIFNIKDNYIYNEPDNTENLYIVIKKLDELSKNMNESLNKNEEGNNENEINNENNNINENDLLKLRQIEEKNRILNNKLIQLGKCVESIENNYNNQKTNNSKILKAINEVQQIIKNSLETNKKQK